MTEIQESPQIFQTSKKHMCRIMSAELEPRPAEIAERNQRLVVMALV